MNPGHIPIFEPYLEGREEEYLLACIREGWISSQGRFVEEFEGRLAQWHGCRHAVATSSCTTALHLCLSAMDIGPGDEVICPALTFIAPVNMVLLCGATPVLVDIDPETLTLAPDALEAAITERTRAILVVHQFGHAADMDAIMDVARRHGLRILEDNAEALGGRYRGRLLGTLGDACCLSFFANKVMTTGEGGAVITDDPDLAERYRIARDHGMSPERRYHHVGLGFNYRMTNMQAAIGLAQLERLDEILKRRRLQMDWYYDGLRDLDGITLREFASWCEPVHWLMTISLADGADRAPFIEHMSNRGVECRPMVFPVSFAEHLRDRHKSGDFPVACDVSLRSLHLPCATNLARHEVQHICSSVGDALRGVR